MSIPRGEELPMATCTHFDPSADPALEPRPSGTGCVECLATGGHWVHLRRCLECGHIGCCDNSPGRHATAHYHGDGAPPHPVVRTGRGVVLLLRRRGRVRGRGPPAEPLPPVSIRRQPHPGIRSTASRNRPLRVDRRALGGPGDGARLGHRLPRRHRRQRGPAHHGQRPARGIRELQWILDGYLVTLERAPARRLPRRPLRTPAAAFSRASSRSRAPSAACGSRRTPPC